MAGIKVCVLKGSTAGISLLRRLFPGTVSEIEEYCADQVWLQVRAASPVDTGRFRKSWGTPFRNAEYSYVLETGAPYATVIEYGRWPGVGPRTVKGPDGGIYSRQAVGGVLRHVLGDEMQAKTLAESLRNIAVDKIRSMVRGLL